MLHTECHTEIKSWNIKSLIATVTAAGLAMSSTMVLGAEETLTPNQNPGWTLPFPSADDGPCEELSNTLGPDKRITIKLNQRERELIHLAIEGWIVDMEHELAGVGGWTGGIYPVLFGDTGQPGGGPADPPFHSRAFFLNYGINVMGPSVQQRVYGEDLVADFNLEVYGGPIATEEELRNNVQEITFNTARDEGRLPADAGQGFRYILLARPHR